MQSCSWMNTHGGMSQDCTTHSSIRGCLYMSLNPGRRRWGVWFAVVASMVTQSWTQRQMYLPSSSWDTRPPEKKSGSSSIRCICWRGCLAPTMRTPLRSTGDDWGHCVLFEGPPLAEERWLFRRKWRTGAHQHSSVPPLGWTFPEGEASYFCIHELPEAREAHWWTLAATFILEERIERLSWLTTRMRLDDCQLSQSWDHSRRSYRWQSQRCYKALDGGGSQAWSPTPSPTWPCSWVTFQDPELMLDEDQAAGQPSAYLNLGPSPKLRPDIEHFLWEPNATQEEEEGSDPLQEPPVRNGLCGGAMKSTHLIGGGSWWVSLG